VGVSVPFSEPPLFYWLTPLVRAFYSAPFFPYVRLFSLGFDRSPVISSSFESSRKSKAPAPPLIVSRAEHGIFRSCTFRRWFSPDGFASFSPTLITLSEGGGGEVFSSVHLT